MVMQSDIGESSEIASESPGMAAVIRSSLPVVRMFLLPYLIVLMLFITVTGAGSAWLYYKVRQAQAELVIHGLLQPVTPVLEHLSHSNISGEVDNKTSWLHRELNIIFTKVPELEHVNLETSTRGFHKYRDGASQLITKTTSQYKELPDRDFRSSTASQRLYNESPPVLHIEFIIKDAKSGPIHLTFGFNRATLRKSVGRAMAIIREAIFFFFALGIGCLLIALGITIWSAKKTRLLEAGMQELYRRAEAAELMSGLVHDLRNPLASFRANLASLQIVPEQREEIIRDMDKDLIRLDDKLSSMLDLTKQRDEKVSEVDVKTFLEQIERLAGPILAKSNLHFKCWANVQEPVLLMENGVRDALLNLIINAAESGQEEGAIECEAWRKNSNLLIAVRDRGKGIPAETDIFAPFVTSKDSGHGLGLAISRRTIEAHGGHIRVEAREGGGTIFTIILPQPTRTGDR